MIKKHYYSWTDIERMCVSIVNQMYADNWRPDYIIGITRGGNVPATILSNMLGIRCEALKVKLRDSEDGEENESNLWMAEEAFGCNNEGKTGITGSRWDISLRKKILIVDDINETGATFNWSKKDWESGCYPDNESWDTVWGQTVKFAVLTENLASEFDYINFHTHEINKAEDDVWLVYPWENIGEY